MGAELTPEALNLKQELDLLAAEGNLKYNPDTGVLNRVLNSMAKRRAELGERYCPCRAVSGVKELDDKIICPCAFHAGEIEENGACHCRLFVKNET